MDQILLAHGSGGTQMRSLIEQLFYESYGSDVLKRGDDAAVLAIPDGVASFAFTTDTFVVTPHFFPGGDIGRLAVCGTVNDLATSGAQPLWLSVAFVLEEGFSMDSLRRICASMAEAAREAEVSIVTGDTKVVGRGQCDGIYINTSGVGVIPAGVNQSDVCLSDACLSDACLSEGSLSDVCLSGINLTDAKQHCINLSGANCQPGDRILLSGTLGDHGIAIVSSRDGLSFSTTLESDTAPLNHLVTAVLAAAPHVRCFRDPTRGGLASTLNEFARQSGVAMLVDEESVPVKDQVRGACDMLGYDIFQVANEGKMVCVVAPEEAGAALAAMRSQRYGVDAAIIGEVASVSVAGGSVGNTAGNSAGSTAGSITPRAYVRTLYGSIRILDELVGEQLPRIC